MIQRRTSGLCAALALALLASACGGVIDPSKNTIEPFSSSLQPGSAVTHNFSVSKNGEVSVTMTSVVPPPPNGTLAVALGQQLGNSCALLSGFQQGVVNRPIPYGFLEKGSYCLQVADPGVLNVAVTYSVSVSHP